MARHEWKNRRRGASGGNERGTVTLVVAGALVLLCALAFGVVRIGVGAAARAQAQVAADAAALAGVAEGRAGAERLVAANRGILRAFIDDGIEVEVEVEADGAFARARAFRQDPPPRVVVIDTTPEPTVPGVEVVPIADSTAAP